MRVSGGGFLAASLSIILLLLIPSRHDRPWIRIMIPVIGLANLVPTLVVTLMIRINTPAAPPYLLVAILTALLVLSLTLSLLLKRH